MLSLANITMPSMPILSNMPSISILSNMPSLSILSVLFTALAMLMGTLFHELLAVYKKLIPRRLLDKILSQLKSLIQSYRSQMTLVINEHINGLSINEMFEASEIYLRPKITPSVERLEISKVPRETEICINISPGQQIMDTFEGIQLTWKLTCTTSEKKKIDDKGRLSYETAEHRAIELKFHKKYREKVLSSYLSCVLEWSKAMKEENKVMKLHSHGGKWSSVNLDHPSTFDTLAMNPTLKREVIDDLDKFVKSREFYRNVGRAWKRGYLLYGPPGTGKSSLIAAMANYLKFHIYDLDLTRLNSNSELQNLILSTANQSILVIEDIDCIKISQNRQDEGKKRSKKRLTLSGLLNFVDGLWSCCGDEKIIIFTTNHKDKLDPALLRPGRMDMHIHMSYCTPCGFKILASKYLGGIQNHSMFTEIEKLVTEVEVTPAEIAAKLVKSNEADVALGGLIKFLHMKKTEQDKAIAEGEKEVDEQGNESPGNKEGAENESGGK